MHDGTQESHVDNNTIIQYNTDATSIRSIACIQLRSSNELEDATNKYIYVIAYMSKIGSFWKNYFPAEKF